MVCVEVEGGMGGGDFDFYQDGPARVCFFDAGVLEWKADCFGTLLRGRFFHLIHGYGEMMLESQMYFMNRQSGVSRARRFSNAAIQVRIVYDGRDRD